MKYLITILILTIASYCFAIDEIPYRTQIEDPVYIDLTKIKIDELIPPMPVRSSIVDLKDTQVLLFLQNNRSEEDCRRGNGSVKISMKTFFGQPYGPLTDREIDQIPEVFKQIVYDTDYFIKTLKKKLSRARPYDENLALIPCAPKEKTLAYPSGHTAISMVLANFLGLRFPHKKLELIKRAYEIGNDRVVVGVHHSSDIVAGRILADNITKLLMKNHKLIKAVTAK